MRRIFICLLMLASISAAQAKKRASVRRSRAPLPSVVFEDITRAAGIDFRLTCGSKEKLYIMDAMCGGIAFIDYDNDGYPDIFLLNGSTLQELGKERASAARLYRNNGNGTFTDVTRQVGLDVRGWGMGVTVGDYDNDGFDDLYLTFLDHAVLLHNDAGKRFTDVTAKAGVADQGHWGTSAAFADYDNDGSLDLYVANYVDLDLKNLPAFGSNLFCQYRGIKVSCGPRGLKGGRDRLFHNNGDGTFTDVTEKSGIDPNAYYGLGVLWLDHDNDGCQDVYVADDSSPSMLYKGDCKGGFTEAGVEAGVAYSADGQEQAGMGVDTADYDHDGRLDIAKVNFSDDQNNLYHNDGKGEFTDVAGPAGIGPVSIPFLGFGVRFIDYDNDGWPDLFIANGHVNPQVEGKGFGVSYRQRDFLFHNLRNGKFNEVGQSAGEWLKVLRVGRGAATADIDNDGRVDLLVSNLDEGPVLARNVAASAANSITLKLIGTKSNRDAIGARIQLVSGGMTQIAEVRANSSYLSASDLRVHFGVGNAKVTGSLTIHWPSGLVETIQEGEAAGQILTIREGSGVIHRDRYALHR